MFLLTDLTQIFITLRKILFIDLSDCLLLLESGNSGEQKSGKLLPETSCLFSELPDSWGKRLKFEIQLFY